MKKTILIISHLLLIMLFASSCSKEDTPPDLPELKYGNFYASLYGEFGSRGVHLTNCKTCPSKMRDIYFDRNSSTCQFEFAEKYLGKSLGLDLLEDFAIIVNLTDIFNTKSYSVFETPVDIKDTSKDWIHLYYRVVWGDKLNFLGTYTSLKGQSDLEVKITSIEYEELKFPSITGTIEGYLYNIEDPKDRISIKADFITQAAY